MRQHHLTPANLIGGDRLLMRSPQGRPQLYRYSLGDPSAGSIDQAACEPERVRRMERRLQREIEALRKDVERVAEEGDA